MALRKYPDGTFKVGDKVWCGGDGGFCHTSTETILIITHKYDEDTGERYPIIHISGNRQFDGRNGMPKNEPWAYYIRPLQTTAPPPQHT
jgi:hypothetical protein